MRRLPAIAAAVAGVVFVLAAARLNAEPRISVECGQYAELAGKVADYREAGAPLEKVLLHVGKSYPPGPVRSFVERAVRTAYEEGLPPDRAAWSAYKRCQDQLGAFPLEG